MPMLNRGLLGLSGLAAAMVLLAGCSGGKAEQSPAAADPGGAAEKKNAEPVELVFHTNSGGAVEGFNKTFGDRISAKFPDYKISYVQSKQGSTLAELMAQGKQVDILYQTDAYYFELADSAKLQYDMTELVKKRGINLNAIEPQVLESLRQSGGGKLYALPISNLTQVMYYNKGIFDKFGVPYPKDGMTWDETLELAKKLDREEQGQQYFGFAASPAHILGNNQLSIPYVDVQTEKPTFLNDGWRRLIDTYIVRPAQGQGYQKYIAEKKRLPYRLEFTDTPQIAMFVFNSNFPFSIPNIDAIDWDLVSLPTFADKPKIGSQSMPVVFGITSTSKQKDAAMEVIQFLVSEETQISESKKGIMPVSTTDAARKAFAQDTPFKNKNWNALYYNQIAPGVPKSNYQLTVEKSFTSFVQQIVEGKKDVNTALREAQEQAEKIIADAKQKK
ncbi:ABC transporter substrate-binding protein [Paenibacillus hemerocallicola]|nr:extracellular solute-binding protein [Paenibacillus hemerocallicola]